MLHKNAFLGDRHALHNWSVASAIERTALSPTADDIGKSCYQQDTKAFFLLTSISPSVVWLELGDSSALLQGANDYADSEISALSTIYQPINDNLDALSALDFEGKAGYVVGVNPGETALALLVSGGGGGGSLTPITADVTYVVDPAGAGDFLTIQEAWDALRNNFSIDAGITVTLRLVDGVHAAGSVLAEYAYGSQVVITGTTVNDYSITSVTSSGSAAAYTYVVTMPDTTGIVIGDILNIFSPSGGTHPQLIAGAWKVTNVTPTTVTFLSKYAKTQMPTGAIVSSYVYVCKTLVTTAISAIGLTIASSLKDLTKLQFEQTGSVNGTGLFLQSGGSVNNYGVWGVNGNPETLISFYNLATAISGITSVGHICNLCIGYCTNGVHIISGQLSLNAFAININSNGLRVTSSIIKVLGSATVLSGFVSIVQGCAGSNINITERGAMFCTAMSASYSSTVGITVQRGSHIYIASSEASYNTGVGMGAYTGSSAIGVSMTYTSNTTGTTSATATSVVGTS
jgi:hypothetical protein